jgi:hypothetical protein
LTTCSACWGNSFAHDYMAERDSVLGARFLKRSLVPSILLLVSVTLAAPSAGALSYSITVKTDASVYFGVQTLVASGSVSPAPGIPNTAVFLEILNPSGSPAAVGSAPVDGATGAYQYNWIIGGSSNWVAGTYSVDVSWSANSTSAIHAITTFSYSPATANTASSTTATTSAISTSTPSPLSTTSASTTSEAAASNTTTSASTSSGSGGIPEFPLRPLSVSAFSALVVASYLLTRRCQKSGV